MQKRKCRKEKRDKRRGIEKERTGDCERRRRRRMKLKEETAIQRVVSAQRKKKVNPFNMLHMVP